MTEKTTFIPARLKSSVVGGHVAGASDIIDDAKGKTQDEINASVEESIDNIQRSATDLSGMVSRNKQETDQKIDAIKGGSSKSIQNLSDEIATKQPTLTFDNAPEAGSSNPVKSSGIKSALDTKVDKVTGKGLSPEEFTVLEKEKLNALPTNATLQQALDSKQDNLEFDNTPTAGSVKMVRSGAIKDYVDAETQRAKSAEQTNANGINGINQKIPSEASAQNQLADKNFVNSSVATNTADYISKGGEPFSSYAELQAYAGEKTNNDYAFVKETDAAGNTVYKRYKYNASSNTWALEYELNNSSFTASQWAAIQSGITAILVNKLIGLPDAAALVQQIANAITASLASYYDKSETDSFLAQKQDTLTIDSTPTVNSGNPISSDAVYDLQEFTINSLNGKQATLTFDNMPTPGSGNPVTSGGVSAALIEAQSLKFEEVDELPVAGQETMGRVFILKQSDESYLWYITIYDQELTPPQFVWRLVNNNSIDLSNYYTISQVDTLLEGKQDVLDFATEGECDDAANELT